jgi:hypothetical protein
MFPRIRSEKRRGIIVIQLSSLVAGHQPNLYLSREARLYDNAVGSGTTRKIVLRFDSPDDPTSTLGR